MGKFWRSSVRPYASFVAVGCFTIRCPSCFGNGHDQVMDQVDKVILSCQILDPSKAKIQSLGYASLISLEASNQPVDPARDSSKCGGALMRG